MIRIEEIRDWSHLEPHVGAWDALAQAPGATVFQSFEWHAAWWRAFGEGYELRVLLAWAGAELAAIAPWAVNRRERELQFLGSTGSDYCDLLVAPAHPGAVDAFAGWLLANRRAWRLVDFRNVPSHSPHRVRLESCLRAGARWVCSEVETDAPTRVLGDAAADREALNKASLKRHFRHFARSGRLEFEQLTSAVEVEPLLDNFFAQHAERRALAGGKSQFSDPRQQRLYRELVRLLAPRDWLRFGVVRLDGEPIAFHFGFEYGGRFIWYKPAFSAVHAKHSPGEVLLKFLLEYAVGRGLAEFDFTIGSEPFKYRFANRVRSNHRIRVYSLPTDYWLRRARGLAKRILRPGAPAAAVQGCATRRAMREQPTAREPSGLARHGRATLVETDSTAKVAASMDYAAKRTSTESLSFREIQMTTSSPAFSSFRSLTRLVLAVMGAGLLALPATASAQSGDTIGEGDTVHVTVFQNPDLSVDGRVGSDGAIPYPLLGQVKIAGLTTAAAGGRIADQLKRGGYLKSPQVTVAVTAMRSRQVSVLGHVARPGRYALDDASSRLTDVLALAGGIAPTGDDIVQVMINRGGKIAKMSVDVPVMFKSGDLSKNIEVRSGDTIFVSRAPVFYIYGEVTHSGAYRLEQNMSVMQALSVGGGLSPRGTDRGLKINRLLPDGSVRTLDAKLTDLVQVDDVIYVKESIF